MKKILLPLICLLAMPTISYAQEGNPVVENDGISYEIIGEEAILSDGKRAYGAIAIPSEVEFEGKKYSVTAIADNAFKSDDYEPVPIYSVEIPASVRKIGNWAFSQTALTEIEIPETVTAVGIRAFSYCTSMKKAVIYGGKEEFGSDVFDNCDVLESAIIGEGHTVVAPGMFFYCRSLKDVQLPSSLIEIQSGEYGSGSFKWCSSLKSIQLPEGLVSIDRDAFGNSGLTSITLPESVTSIGNSTFGGCSSLESVKLSSSLSEIPPGAFSLCPALESIEIPDGVAAIGGGSRDMDGCFRDCVSLKEVKLSKDLKEIGGYAFYGCTSLTNMEFPDCLTSLGQNAFEGCSSLKNISIGSSLKVIGEACFNNLSSLEVITVDPSNPYFSTIDGILADKMQTELILAPKSLSGTLTLPSSVRTLKSGVFSMCEDLSGLILNDGLEKIESFVISGCTSLSELAIPSSVDEIADEAFRNNSLTSFTVDANNPNYSSRVGLLLDKLERAVLLGVVSASTLTLPATVTIIADKAFSCFDVSELICNEGLETIGQEAFLQSTIEKISFSSTVTSILRDAFISCGNLKSITFPPNITYLETGAFMLTGVEEVVFTGGIKVVPSHLFNYCASLKKVDLTGVESIGYSAFFGNWLDSLSIPETVYYIGDSAFKPSWEPIKSVKCYAMEPPVLGGNNVFCSSWDSSELEVQVPNSSLELYRSADYWKDFILTGFDDVSSVEAPGVSAASHWIVYGLDGRLILDTDDYGKVSSLTPGLYIINGKKQIIH